MNFGDVMKFHEKTSNSYFRSRNRNQILRSLIASTTAKAKDSVHQKAKKKKSSVSVERTGNYVTVNPFKVLSKPVLLVDDNLETIICLFMLPLSL